MRDNIRICFFNSTRTWGGGEKWHLETCHALLEKKTNVILFAGVRSILANKAAALHLPLQIIRVSNLSFLNPLRIWALMKLFRRYNLHTVILNLSADVKFAGLAAKWAGIERIIYRRGSAIPIKNTWLNRYLFKQVITDVLANSEETKRTILQNNPNLIPKNRIKVIYNGLKIQNYPLFEKRKPVTPFVIGNLGRMVYQKGQNLLLDIAVELRKVTADFQILIGGDGPYKEELVKQVQNKKLDRFVTFLGYVEDVTAFMEKIDVFVLTSHWEGFGYVLAEAMLCGKPVLAFDVSSNPEIIVHNKTGFIVPYPAIEEYAGRILELIEDKDLYRKFTKQGRKRVEEDFNFEHQIEKVYMYLLN